VLLLSLNQIEFTIFPKSGHTLNIKETIPSLAIECAQVAAISNVFKTNCSIDLCNNKKVVVKPKLYAHYTIIDC